MPIARRRPVKYRIMGAPAAHSTGFATRERRGADRRGRERRGDRSAGVAFVDRQLEAGERNAVGERLRKLRRCLCESSVASVSLW
jgi:hypothetical protein